MKPRNITTQEERRIYYAIKNKIMHFSPTISPAPKNLHRDEIESIREAIFYYFEKGIKDIIVQPKYMGSYCDIYLHKDIEKTQFFSRNGYDIPESKIPREKLIDIVKPLRDRLDYLFKENAEMIIIQAELLPWVALGAGLIEKEFKVYEACHKDRISYIKDTGLLESIQSLKDDSYKKFVDDYMTLPESQVKKLYSSHIYNHYTSLMNMDISSIEQYENNLNIYSEQLEIYSKDSEPSFSPFNVLKIIYSDGTEEINESNIKGFNIVSDDIKLVLNLREDYLEDSIDKAYDFFYHLVHNDMEGVIIKPDKIWQDDIAPMFKVRNNKYLQLIYGINFNSKYSYYLNKRKIKNKVKCSINEWNIAQTLLRIPLKEINNDNEEYKRLVTMRILEEDLEKTLDSRL